MICDVFYYVKVYLAASTAPDPRSGGCGFKVLKPTLLSLNDPCDLFELRFVLNNEIDVFESEHLIRYRIQTTEFETDEITIPMSNVLR